MKAVHTALALGVAGWCNLAHASAPPRSESGLRADMWTPPDAPAGEATVYVAAQSWDTAYGGRDPNLTLGLTGGLYLLSWLELQAVADFSARRESPANLQITNTATFVGAGPSFGLWLGDFHIHADAAAGGVMRTLAYDDGADSQSSDVRFAPAWQIGGGIGVGLFGRFGIGFNSYGRFHHDRANVLFALETSWFFQ